MAEKKLAISQEIEIPIGGGALGAHLTLAAEATGLVLFAHGSGSGRHSPRNQVVAKFLQEEGLGTLLLDLLTPAEEEKDLQTKQLRFNIPFLAERLLQATAFIESYPETHALSLGYFGASTGAAAALIAAAEEGEKIKAVVSRGGRPDLAGNALSRVKAPTLLIVGGADFGVIELNVQAFDLLQCPKKMEIVAEATHLFEEPGALEQVAKLASKWFNFYL